VELNAEKMTALFGIIHLEVVDTYQMENKGNLSKTAIFNNIKKNIYQGFLKISLMLIEEIRYIPAKNRKKSTIMNPNKTSISNLISNLELESI
jgi:hypothetical protein